MSAGGDEEGQVYCIASVKREHESVGIAVASHPSDCLECAIITCNLDHTGDTCTKEKPTSKNYIMKREKNIN